MLDKLIRPSKSDSSIGITQTDSTLTIKAFLKENTPPQTKPLSLGNKSKSAPLIPTLQKLREKPRQNPRVSAVKKEERPRDPDNDRPINYSPKKFAQGPKQSTSMNKTPPSIRHGKRR